ncbi:MAG: hypothetical protein AAF429_13705, partial [Pseudomonadota bacterium]
DMMDKLRMSEILRGPMGLALAMVLELSHVLKSAQDPNLDHAIKAAQVVGATHGDSAAARIVTCARSVGVYTPDCGWEKEEKNLSPPLTLFSRAFSAYVCSHTFVRSYIFPRVGLARVRKNGKRGINAKINSSGWPEWESGEASEDGYRVSQIKQH